MSEIAIEVNNLCVDYKIISSFSIRHLFARNNKQKSKFIHAVRDVSFQVEKGEILGIIGKNGSGKSTLLKTIAGIFSPNKGSVTVNGSCSLLSIGVGFNKAVSGRENIILCGMLLGFSKQQILDHMEEIIEFSELGDFIDKPVRTYSSGMYSKLAFSITAILETDVMLIDEVLSVGDEHFKKKSLKKMKELINDENRTVVIVSHSLSTLKDLCTKIMWFHEGEIRKVGKPKEILKEYKEFMN